MKDFIRIFYQHGRPTTAGYISLMVVLFFFVAAVF